MSEEKRDKLAFFRYQIIAPLLSIPSEQSLCEAIKKLSQNYYETPDQPYPKRFSSRTIESWYYSYKKGGLDFLRRVKRKDSGESKTLKGEIALEVEKMLTENPGLDGPTVLKELVARELIKEGEVSLTSFYRFRKARGLKKNATQSESTYRAFAFGCPQDCYQADLLFGPKLPTKDGKLRKTYLIGMIDDCTRVVPHAQFYFDQDLYAFLDTFKQAILKRGVCKKIYIDNAFIFRSTHLLRITASLGAELIHSRPYRPQGRGKIERFFRTVRDQFLQRVEPKTLSGIEELNALFWAWLEGEYHTTTHRALGETPLDKWLRLSDFTHPLSTKIDLDRIFLHEKERLVRADGTFQIKKCRFEAPLHLMKKKVKVHYDPRDLRRVYLSLDGQQEGIAYPLDLQANSNAHRAKPKTKDKKKTQEPLKSLYHLKKSMEEKNGENNPSAD